MDKGDWSTSKFFKAVGEKSRLSIITQLKAANNQLVSGEQALEEVCHRYYEDLYLAPNEVASDAEREAVLDMIPQNSTK